MWYDPSFLFRHLYKTKTKTMKRIAPDATSPRTRLVWARKSSPPPEPLTVSFFFTSSVTPSSAVGLLGFDFTGMLVVVVNVKLSFLSFPVSGLPDPVVQSSSSLPQSSSGR